MDLGIQGKKAAVAAASTGLGFGCAKALIEDGVQVAVCSRSQERISEAAEQLGAGAVPIVADMSSEEGARSFVEQATARLGQVDILVANAGGPPPGFPGHHFDRRLPRGDRPQPAVDDRHVPDGASRHARTRLGTDRGGHLDRRPPADRQSRRLLGARAGVSSFLKTLSAEVARDGVTVNSAQPGIHATDRIKSLGNTDVVAQRVPTGTLGAAEDFGKAVAFLCSEPKFITGTSILLDGGAYQGLI